MKLIGGNPEPQVTGLDALRGKVNYFIGNDPKKWHAGFFNGTDISRTTKLREET